MMMSVTSALLPDKAAGSNPGDPALPSQVGARFATLYKVVSLSAPSVELALAASDSLPTGARLLLWVVIGLLLMTLGILVAMALMMRRRHRAAALAADEEEEPDGEVLFDEAELDDLDLDLDEDEVICPECLERYGADKVRCPSDGQRLLLRSELEELDGRVCPICSRGFTESICFCPHDGAALVVADPRRALRLATAPGESSGKICPRCRTRHEYRFAFCTRDGAELRILN